jgi:outer membrane cobalamin receptor
MQNNVPTTVGDFAIGDIALGYTFGPKKALRSYGAVKNITNKAYETIAGYSDIGKTFSAGLQVRY